MLRLILCGLLCLPLWAKAPKTLEYRVGHLISLPLNAAREKNILKRMCG